MLGAMTFEPTGDSVDIEKCFGVMGCSQERRVNLATFVLKGSTGGYVWKGCTKGK